MPPRRSPRLAELAQRAENVSIALDDDDTESLQSTAVCVVCGDESLRSSLVHIPRCDYLTHPMCVDDDIDAFCPYCSMDLRSTLEHIGNSSYPECGDAVDPSSAGHGALCMFSCCPESPYHVQCLSRVAVAEGDLVFCPRCQGGRRDHVDVGWFQRMCHINGVDWPVPPQVTCVLCMDSMGEDRVAVPCCNQEVHVGCLAQSFNACGARCRFCVQPLREFAESPVFQAAALFHGHSVDVTRQPTNRGTNSLVLPSGFPSPLENLSLLCCCRVGPPPQFEPSVDRRMQWSPVWQQSTLVWDLQWICVSCSRTVPASDIPSCPQVPCGNFPVLPYIEFWPF